MIPTYSTKTHSFDEIYPVMLQVSEQVASSNHRAKENNRVANSLFEGNFINEHILFGEYDFFTEDDKIIGILHTQLYDVVSPPDYQDLLNQQLTSNSFLLEEIEDFSQRYGARIEGRSIHLLQGIRSFKPRFGKEMLRSYLEHKDVCLLINTSGRETYYEEFGFENTNITNHSGYSLLFFNK